MFYFVASLMFACVGAALVCIEHALHGTFTGWAIFWAGFCGASLCNVVQIALYAANKSHKAGW